VLCAVFRVFFGFLCIVGRVLTCCVLCGVVVCWELFVVRVFRVVQDEWCFFVFCVVFLCCVICGDMCCVWFALSVWRLVRLIVG